MNINPNPIVYGVIKFLLIFLISDNTFSAQGKFYRFSTGQNLPINIVGGTDVVGLCELQISAMPEKYIGIANIVNYPGGGRFL